LADEALKAAETEGLSNNSASEPAGALFADVAGLIMFGPVLGGELAIGHASLSVYGRWLDGGYLARQMFPDDDEGESFAFSYGVGIKGRYYLSGGLRGFSLGIAAEYLRSSIENENVLIATHANIFVPQLEVAYRQAFGRFFIGGAGAIGYALELSSSVEDLPGGNEAEMREVEDFSTIYGSVAVEIGLFL
jgi:hypothetical protein